VIASTTSDDAKMVDPVDIRAARFGDTAFLTDVFLRSLREANTAARGAWDEAREKAQFLEQLDLSRTWVIGSCGIAIGFSKCRARDADMEIHTLGVAPEYQRQGNGAHVTQMLVATARETERGAVLSVLKANAGARRLYESLGFEVVSESGHHYHMRFRPS